MTLAMWAGVECTVNRVGDRYNDQCVKNGHDHRLEDFPLFADLGIQRIRYPCVWEKAATDDPTVFRWEHSDERLNRMRELGLTPIAGLLHHGSGPRGTSLIDPEFPEKFATYARAFAARYPWIEDYTPINEPLTTARFSCLYGLWYPHCRDDASFIKACLNQTRATILAMREIRVFQPRARLIQTDDLGRATSTPQLELQCEFENNRRWLCYDLLCGWVGPGHPLWKYLCKFVDDTRELDWIRENPCPPDVLGVNHYLLSNRFLDHKVELYPEVFVGFNGVDTYADVGAVDSGRAHPPTPTSIFREAWERYKIPLAVTEAHVAGPREAQMRWLNEIREAALQLQKEGVRFEAITAWSLLGSFDWNSLCTVCNQFYESGVFDVRSPLPRATRLVSMIQAFSRGEKDPHPLLEGPGWWKTPRRVLFAPTLRAAEPVVSFGRPLLLTGATGTLGKAFARVCEHRGINCRLVGRGDMDIADHGSVERLLKELNPWAVVNTAGYVKVDQAEIEPERCYRENVQGPQVLAEACAARKIPMLTFSSDLVFDGALGSPYLESHPVAPLNVYGHSKAKSEQQVLDSHSDALIVRTSSFFGPWDEHNFVTQTLRNLNRGQEVCVVSDVRVSPTYVPDLVNVCLDLLIDGEKGVLHLTNQGEISWSELAMLAIRMASHKPGGSPLHNSARLVERPLHTMNWPAARPRYSALGSERLQILPSLDDALNRYFSQLEIPM